MFAHFYLDYLAAKVLWELSVQLKTVVTETPFHDVLQQGFCNFKLES